MQSIEVHQMGLAYAQHLDSQDSLAHFRELFHFPKQENGEPITYFCGNSLGLQPKATQSYVQTELDSWANLAVEGHFKGKNPFLYYHKKSLAAFAHIVGAQAEEVIAMNNLTVNLHLMLVSFYQPKGKRVKMLVEAGAFPSDQYAFETQAKFHGLNPDEVVVEMHPRAGERTLRTEDIVAKIEELGDELALLIFGGINYLTGQVFDMETLTKAAHSVGAYAGFDLAHIAGNVPIELHNWGVDFAVWCTYKYMNAGPGAVAGAFVHERHANNNELPRFAGWWGYDEPTRFLMKKGFVPMKGAAGWQLSNTNVLTHAALQASLDIFMQTSMQSLRAKSELITGYLEFLVKQITSIDIQIITPPTPKDRGAQLSLVVSGGKAVFNYLVANGIIGDWREPDVIRIAPAPLYNSFADVYRFYEVLNAYKAS